MVEVNIGPREPERFSLPEPGSERHNEQVLHPVAPNSVQ
jgi:hypothetical protein